VLCLQPPVVLSKNVQVLGGVKYKNVPHSFIRLGYISPHQPDEKGPTETIEIVAINEIHWNLEALTTLRERRER
jgi:hypothetical protein